MKACCVSIGADDVVFQLRLAREDDGARTAVEMAAASMCDGVRRLQLAQRSVHVVRKTLTSLSHSLTFSYTLTTLLCR